MASLVNRKKCAIVDGKRINLKVNAIVTVLLQMVKFMVKWYCVKPSLGGVENLEGDRIIMRGTTAHVSMENAVLTANMMERMNIIII